MDRGIRWMAILAIAGLFVAAAFGVAAASDGSGTAGPEGEYEHGAMLGDMTQDRDRDRIHVDDASASTSLEGDQDRIRDQARLRDGSCQEETTATDGAADPARTTEQTRTRSGHEGECGGQCWGHEEQNQNAGQDSEPQQEQNVSGEAQGAGGPEGAGQGGQ